MLTSLLLITIFAACQPVSGGRILGSDLALADSRLAALPSTLIAGFAAPPGANRTFRSAEIGRLARANGVEILNPPELCFTVPLRYPDREEVIQAVRRTLDPGATFEIVEVAATAVPAGDLQFPMGALEPALGGTRIWRGYVKYAETRKAPFWARVRVTDAPALRRGDTVKVEVRSGEARIHFEAVAECAARTGELVELRNPVNGKTFKARLESLSTAVLVLKL